MAPVFSTLRPRLPIELILMIQKHTTFDLWGSSLVDNPWFMIEPFKWTGILLEFLILDLDDPIRAEKTLCYLEDSRARLTAVKQLEIHIQDNHFLCRILTLFCRFTSLGTLKLQCDHYSNLNCTLQSFLNRLPYFRHAYHTVHPATHGSFHKGQIWGQVLRDSEEAFGRLVAEKIAESLDVLCIMAPVFSSLKPHLPAELILVIGRYTTFHLWGSSLVDNPWFMIEPFKWEGMLLEFLVLDLGDPIRAEKTLCYVEDSRARLTAIKQLELHIRNNHFLSRILMLFPRFTSLHTLKLECDVHGRLHRTLKPFLNHLPSLSVQYLILQYAHLPAAPFHQSITPPIASIQQLTVHFKEINFGSHFTRSMPLLHKALPNLQRAYYLTHVTDTLFLDSEEEYGHTVAEELGKSLDVIIYSRLIKIGQSDFEMRKNNADLPDYI
ncbi:hypothetical protein A0H81_15012 [Grifola frondosa]|uniref:Uncharacterized protein n=1 Tax=Grifola frondosa TaxID=5627 RepID=A0A1C7LL79_GRIFR|nr:hypothetical protein A0H81_15012 [Grifola frondosa]